MAIAPPPPSARAAPGSSILLHKVPWPVYESFVVVPENRHVRMAYDGGDLELMSPSAEHEIYANVFRRIIETLGLALAIPIKGRGSMTFRRADLDKGLEPDACYYMANERRIRGKRRIDLTVDPPPDLAVEVDITSSSLDRLALYAALGVPEVWRFDGESLRVYALGEGGTYAPAGSSAAFPFLPLAEVARFAVRGEESDDTTWARSFRAWGTAEIIPRFPAPGAGEDPA